MTSFRYNNETSPDLTRHASSDIRRRLRTHHGVAYYTLKVLIERLRMRGKRLRDSNVALLGFAFERAPNRNAEEIRSALLRHGARVAILDTEEVRRPIEELKEALTGADAVIIAADHRLFRAIRPKEFRELGIDIVIPTTLFS